MSQEVFEAFGEGVLHGGIQLCFNCQVGRRHQQVRGPMAARQKRKDDRKMFY
jgi:hypothetical protein